MSYCTLEQLELEGKEVGSNANAAPVIQGRDYFVSLALDWVTKRIDVITQQEFSPRRQTRYFDATADMSLDPYLNSVILDKPLVDVVSVTVADTVLTQWTPDLPYSQRVNYDYFLYPIRETPYYKLQATKTFYPLFDPSLFSAFSWYPQAQQQAIAVDGLWCWREYYESDGWRDSEQTVQNAPLTVTGTTLLLANASAFSPGQWFRFRDQLVAAADEFALVVSVNTGATPNEVTIARHERGSVAVEHAQNCPIDLWITEPNINRACARWVNYLYKRRAVYEKTTVQMGQAGAAVISFPQDCPEEIAAILGAYTNFHISRA